ncbi:class I SAM-dependent methyltransferase [Hydrogenovibrio halophilus]|uniref:class I SAM-dependent methyltransferase n=1 Tax=Hydrogenovibrio halophilus TaxID=373391 RepID=UPI000368F832|nr:methyltransferase domain-containing protein [Hydrogenovibrio halophilus]
MNQFQSREVLKHALNLWWLRPENALALASYVINGVDLTPKNGEITADYACGDGVNTFFKCGGRFTEDFDLFIAGAGQQKTSDVAAKDIDVFDYYDQAYRPVIEQRPAKGVTYGTDHKENLLKKAETLGFYQSLHLADLRDEVKGIEDGSIDKVYCNSLYWVAETDVALQAMKRKLKPSGVMVVDVFTTEKKELDWGKLMPDTPDLWQQLLNRGRQATNPGLRDEISWEALFSGCGLEIVESRDILPASLAHIWNLGMRPIFPVLNKLAANLSGDNRMEIKQEWVEVFTELLLPVLDYPELFGKDQRHYRMQYVLQQMA